MTETFLEKYRPSDFNSPYLISTDAVNQIKNMDINALPNLLFTGPPGTGKTTIAKIIAKTLHNREWGVILGKEVDGPDARRRGH